MVVLHFFDDDRFDYLLEADLEWFGHLKLDNLLSLACSFKLLLIIFNFIRLCFQLNNFLNFNKNKFIIQ